MKENYQKRMEEIISTLEGRPKLLLHACCAPCATHAAACLKQHFEVTLYYYNPNTHPQKEYLKRLDALYALARRYELPILEGEYRESEFYEAAKGLEHLPEGAERCAACFSLRMSGTARAAAEHGFDFFSTTLTVSPHKDAQLINGIGLAMQRRFAVQYLPSDFKKQDGFKLSVALSKEFGLYRQDYCGCEFSLRHE